MKSKIFFSLSLVSTIIANDYNRKDYMTTWLDLDRDGLNTRMEVLIKECLPGTPITLYKNKSGGVTVKTGKWYCAYTGDTLYNAKELDIDHVVPLAEVHRSGGYLWGGLLKKTYANDNRNSEVLIAVSKSANRSKGDKDPSEWLPNKDKRKYVLKWKRIKKLYKLDYDIKELKFIKDFLK